MAHRATLLLTAPVLALTAQPPAPPQAPFPSPPTPFRSVSPVQVQDIYGEPEGAHLEEISNGTYNRRTVRTRGTLETLDASEPAYFQLREGPARVVVIPMPALADSLRALVGQRIEAVGLVRELERNQGTCMFRGNPNAPRSLCADPELPPKPDLDRPNRLQWPPWSITVWSAFDEAPSADGKRTGPRDRLADLLDGAGEAATVTAVGRFCGANLCGGLTTPAPSREAWVLQDGETAIWVVGRRPEGSGFRLDPAYRGDTARWLEVKGRLEPCGASRCLRARAVALAARPVEEDPPD